MGNLSGPTSMQYLQSAIENQLQTLSGESTSLRRDYADQVLGQVKVAQLLGGLRGVAGLICETSTVDPQVGLMIRGRPVSQLTEHSVEEVFWLLLSGDFPGSQEMEELQSTLSLAAHIPTYVQDLWRALPEGSHPMVCLSAAVGAMSQESEFRRAYGRSADKELWRSALLDALQLAAKLPLLAVGVYEHCYGKGSLARAAAGHNWHSRLSAGLGEPAWDMARQSEFSELLRLLTIVQSDHEGGNACALSASVVASALSDPYLAVSAGMNALAGPIHGLASQICLQLLLEILDHFGRAPDEAELEQYCLARVASGRVLPGFGHAVLRAADPRYLAVREFVDAHGISDPVLEVCRSMSRVGPKVLLAGGKASNPWPNIDGISGAALYHYGIVEPDFYTVNFAVSISLGVLAQYVVNRGLGRPLFRPRSISLAGLRQLLASQ